MDRSEEPLVAAEEAVEGAKEVAQAPSNASASAKRSVRELADKYRERAELLDHVLGDVAGPLGEALRQEAKLAANGEFRLLEAQEVCKLVILLVNARGVKALERFLPHDGRDLPGAATLYEAAEESKGSKGEDRDPDAAGTAWETRAVLLDWMALLCLTPFPLASLGNELGHRIMEIGKRALAEAGAGRDRAGRLLGRLMARPDTDQLMVDSFLPFALNGAIEGDLFLAPGCLRALANAFKLCPPQRASECAQRAWEQLRGRQGRTPLERHVGMKAAQRVAVAMLNRSGGLQEAPSEIEEAVTWAVDACRDRDTSVRWSGAKGLARITRALGEGPGEDVISSALSLLSHSEQDAAWHGGCLAVAELARRKLLPRSKIEEVASRSREALFYERRQRAGSVGESVRDAGAFVAWALARGAPKDALQGRLTESVLAPAMAAAACLDREVHCRRAAAAAFQEWTGRVGAPSGLSVVALADYMAVGSKQNAFLSVAPEVLSLGQPYSDEIAMRLKDDRARHWDPSLRELAAKAIANCCEQDSALFRPMLTDFLDRCTSQELPVRHGAALAAAELLPVLQRSGERLSEWERNQIAESVPNVESARLYRGKGGEQMRGACCRLLRRAAEAQSLACGKKHLERLERTVRECLVHPTDAIRDEAVKAAVAMATAGMLASQQPAEAFVAELSRSENPAAQRGYAQVLGEFPSAALRGAWKNVASALARAVKPSEDPDERDAEARSLAAKSLRKLLSRATEEGEEGAAGEVKQWAEEGARVGMKDHCTDNRGDVGSWVREPALLLATELSELVGSDSEFACDSLRLALREANERLDRLRVTATACARRLALSAGLEGVAACLPVDGEGCSEPRTAFAWMEQLLAMANDGLELWKDVADGMSCSAGGPGGEVCKAAVKALEAVARKGPNGSVRALRATFEPALRRPMDIRSGQSTLRAAERLMDTGAVNLGGSDEGQSTAEALVTLVRSQVRGSGDVTKLCAGGSVLAHLAHWEATRRQAVKAMGPLLGHRFPKVRRAAADALYLRLLPLAEEEEEEGGDSGGACSQAVEALEQCEWERDVKVAREARDTLCDALGVERPKRVDQGAPKEEQQGTDDLSSYAALVDDAGY